MRSARARFWPPLRQLVDHSRCFPARRQNRILRRYDAHGFARTRQRSTAKTLGDGQSWSGARAEKNQGGRRWNDDSQGDPEFVSRARFSDRSAEGKERRIFSRHRARTRARDSRISAFAESNLERSTSIDGRAGTLLPGPGWSAP